MQTASPILRLLRAGRTNRPVMAQTDQQSPCLVVQRSREGGSSPGGRGSGWGQTELPQVEAEVGGGGAGSLPSSR